MKRGKSHDNGKILPTRPYCDYRRSRADIVGAGHIGKRVHRDDSCVLGAAAMTNAQAAKASQICEKALQLIGALQKNLDEMKAAQDQYERWLKERER